jgi:hypothetical protein
VELKYMVSADFGQTFDYSTVAVIERRLEKVGEPYQFVGGEHLPRHRRIYEMRQDVEQRYDLIRLDRVPLRTPYTKIAKGIVTLIKELYRKQLEENPDASGQVVEHPRDPGKPIVVGLAIDEGGVGKAVRDILVKEMLESVPKDEPRIAFLPVTVHGGSNTTRSGGFYHVPKKDLISAGFVAYQTYQNHKLRVGKLKWRSVLEEELTNYRLKQNINTNHVSFEPLREGQHDDLLFAVCLGCWAWENAIKKIKHLSTPNAIMTDLEPSAALQQAPPAR